VVVYTDGLIKRPSLGLDESIDRIETDLSAAALSPSRSK
jgi:hypothetical protein